MVGRVADTSRTWDVLVVGAGATGLGTAIESTSRGYRTLVVDGSDFAKGTSSRSTKLVHGGIRYLQQGNVSLVLEALKERGRLRQNAPHLVHDLPFIVPNYDWWEAPFYGIGMKVYDLLARQYSFGRSKILSRDAALEAIPTLRTDGLRGGVRYYDDSKATNVGAVVKSLDGFSGRVVLLAGGLEKGGGFTALRPAVAERVRQVVAYGRARNRIAADLGDAAPVKRVLSKSFQPPC